MLRDDFHPEREPDVSKGYTVGTVTTAPDYFRAMSIRVIRGRDFSANDDAGATPVAIISASVARKFWPPDRRRGHWSADQEAGANKTAGSRSSGIVDDVAQTSVASEREGAQYFPITQNRTPWSRGSSPSWFGQRAPRATSRRRCARFCTRSIHRWPSGDSRQWTTSCRRPSRSPASRWSS